MHFAAETLDSVRIINLLNEYGHSPNHNMNGTYPIHHAASTCIENVKELVKLGCDINIKNESGLSPIHVAVKSCPRVDFDFLMEMVNLGAKLDDVSVQGHNLIVQSIWGDKP